MTILTNSNQQYSNTFPCCHDQSASRQGRDWYIAQGGQGLAAEDDDDEDNDFVYNERGL